MTTPAVLHFTLSAAPTARRAAKALGGEVVTPGEAGVADTIRALFAANRPLVGVCAAAILIRALAPMLTSKRDEPPVVALSEDGASAVPLLGGHRGANALARRLAEAFEGAAAITTAGEARLGLALDEPPEGWTLLNPEDAKSATAKLLAGAEAELSGDAPWLAPLGAWPVAAPGAS